MNATEYKNRLFHPKTDKYSLLGYLKKEDDLTKIKKIYKQVSFNPFVKSIISGNISPQKYNDIRRRKILPYSDSFIGEATWLLITFEENLELLNIFISLKLKYEHYFLLCQYEQASMVLKEIDSKIGKSIWLIENQLILDEYQTGVQANWTLLSELSKEINDSLILFFLENLSKRAESKISYFRYSNMFENQMADINASNEFIEYLCFRLNYQGFSGYKNFAYLLCVENSFSLVDRYLLLKDVLCEMLSPRFQNQNDERVFLIADYLHKLFPFDNQVKQIRSILDINNIVYITTNPTMNELLDEYTKGDYAFCVNKSPSIIKESPFLIEVYEIYVKSLIELNMQLAKTDISDNVDMIIEILYNIYTNSLNFETNFSTGLKLSTTFYSTSWAKQLLSLIKSSSSHDTGDKQFTIDYVLSSQVKNPRIIYYIPTKFYNDYAKIFYVEKKLKETSKLHLDILLGNSGQIIENININQDKKYIFAGRALIKEKQYENAKTHFELLLKENRLSIISKVEIIVNLYRCYLKLSLLKEACCLFVMFYLENRQITKRINKEKLLSLITDSDKKHFDGLIELPIFFKIASFDSYQEYVAYDTFLESINMTRPRELIAQTVSYDNKLIFFLRNVCSIEIMHHSYHYSGTDDLENERLLILNKLIVVDKKNEDIYIKEITELNQNSNIRKAIREVNKGRISINVRQLRQNEFSDIKEAFSRFKEIDIYSKEKEILGIDSSANMLTDLSHGVLDDIIPNKVVYTNDPSYISFKVIFTEIRDKFILSKEYGLDGYLSTRIRHGTLLNHIRSIFESQNIISQRDKDNNYLDNEFWNHSLLHSSEDTRINIQNAIKKFSQSIDDYTESIIKDLIQVKTEKNLKKSLALFDYSITNKEFAYLFATVRENIKDYNTFISFVFEFLEGKTEIILSQIRKRINNELKTNYDKILQDFNTDVKNIIGNNNFPELISSINFCGTKLQHELKNISEWFYLSNTSKDLSLDLNVLIQTSIQITNTIYPTHQIKPQIIENSSIPMVSTIHLIYIFRILLDNIIKHSKLPSNQLNIEISSEVVDEEYIQIKFKNNLSTEINEEQLAAKLDEVKRKWETSSNDFENVNSEGNSGFDKIRRIIAFDLECQKYFFNYQIENHNIEIILSIEFLNVPKYVEE